MTFAHPEIFWLFLFLPLLLWGSWQRTRREAVPLPTFSLFRKARSPFFIQSIPLLCIAFLFSGFLILLARPQIPLSISNESGEGIDIFLAIDVSESMLAEDLKPNRMEAAKKVLSSFVEELTGNRVGIIIFSGKPFTQSPLTFDTNILQEYMKTITTDSIEQRYSGLGGTAIGDALLSAVKKFGDEENRSKVIILLTDGDANVGADPKIAAQYAHENNVRIYTIGIGTKEGAPLPYRDAFGQKQYIRDPSGNLAMSKFNEASLRSIAETADGQYFRADSDQSLSSILEEIDTLEKSKIEYRVATKYRELFLPFAEGTFILLLLFLGIRTRFFPAW